MANDEHVALLKQGVAAWNAWREENPKVRPDLTGVDLTKANLYGVNFFKANLIRAHLAEANLATADLLKADLSGAHLAGANLSGAALNTAHLGGADLTKASLQRALLDYADLCGADLSGASLREANLHHANLNKAYLSSANLRGANLSEADLSGAILITAMLVDTDLTAADLTGCYVYGVSAWGLKLEKAKQQNLIITKSRGAPFGPGLVEGGFEPEITVDNLEVAQFIYLLLHNEKVRDVIDTITSKAVLILGRFTPDRKVVLDALREELRRRDYLPILFDFDKPANRDVTETISLLARMARFVVADITDAKAVPQELGVIVPHLPSVPVQPLLLKESSEYGMFEHYVHFPCVLPLYRYETPDQLIAALSEHVIEPAERKTLELHSGARPIPTII